MAESRLLSVVCLLVAAAAAVMGADNAGRCAGGYPHGSDVDRGRYWYLCDNGQLVPKGCYSDNRKKLNIWESYISDGYEMTCVLDEQGSLSFQFTACVKNSSRYLPGDSFSEGKWWYTCSKKGDVLALQVSGCVSTDGRKVNIGDEVEKEGFVYQCQRTHDGKVGFCGVGCIHKGRRYKTGESFEDEKFWYTCTVKDGQCVKQCVGCTNFDQRLKDGDRYFKNDVIFQCEVRQDSAGHRVVGCLQQDDHGPIERVVGCQWREGNTPYIYEKTCSRRDDLAIKETTSCFYETSDGQYRIKPGCFQIVGDKAVACKDTPQGPVFDTFPADQLHMAYYKKVRMC